MGLNHYPHSSYIHVLTYRGRYQSHTIDNNDFSLIEIRNWTLGFMTSNCFFQRKQCLSLLDTIACEISFRTRFSCFSSFGYLPFSQSESEFTLLSPVPLQYHQFFFISPLFITLERKKLEPVLETKSCWDVTGQNRSDDCSPNWHLI